MKEKQFACVVIGMAIFACFFGIMKMQTKLQEARKEAEAAQTTAETTSRQRVVAAGNYSDLEQKSRAEIAYYEIWKPAFEAFPDENLVTEIFLAEMKKEEVDPFTQDFAPAAYKDKYEVISKLQRADLVFVGGYAKLFNWLGKIEATLPTSRVTSLQVKKAAGDEDIRMELTIDIPVIEMAVAGGGGDA